jgi:hypothetical protein
LFKLKVSYIHQYSVGFFFMSGFLPAKTVRFFRLDVQDVLFLKNVFPVGVEVEAVCLNITWVGTRRRGRVCFVFWALGQDACS